MGTWTEDQQKILTGFCPDDQCRASVFFDESSETVECVLCGQCHDKHMLKDVRKVTDLSEVLKFLRPMLLEKRPEETKVMGISNYVCKLLSPLFTQYGLDRSTQAAKLLSEMGHGNTFNCSRLSPHAFHIDPAHLGIPYYGTDCSGSLNYLSETLSIIKAANDNEDRLIPIHTDGDGHCLVYAISRALIGRELFWHALRENLRCHFLEKLEVYKMHFEDFIHPLEWQEIIAECEPNFVPLDGEPLGLRNIHIFGLANVLKRPIILLDSIVGIMSSGDYSGVFLPAFYDPSECRGKDNKLNKPLCIAWNSYGRNHYIPLVGIQGKPLARLPRTLFQKAWGMPNHLISDYIEFDENACCIVGGDKPLSENYIQQLVSAMKKVYYDVHGINPCLVADVFRFIFKKSGVMSIKPETVIYTAKKLVRECHLYRCINCEALCEFQTPKRSFGDLSHSSDMDANKLQFQGPDEGRDIQPTLICSCPHNVLQHYNATKDIITRQLSCSHCKSRHVRLVDSDGSVHYRNGDRTISKSARSKCGYRHFWNGKEYDNLPDIFSIPLKCKQGTINATVEWFQQESDPALNSNAYQVAEELLQKHFHGETLSKFLVQYVADQLLQITADINNKRPSSGSNSSPKRKSTASSGDTNETTVASGSCSSSSGSGASPKRKSATTSDGTNTISGSSRKCLVQNTPKLQSGSPVELKNRETQRTTQGVILGNYLNCEYPTAGHSIASFRRSKKPTPSAETGHSSSKLFQCKDSLTSDKKGDSTTGTEGKEGSKKAATATVVSAALPKTSYSKSDQPTYQRLGPGFSVLEGAEHSNVTNHSLELLHTLAKNIDPAIFDQLKDSEIENNQVEGDDDDLSSPRSSSSCDNSEDMDI